MSRWGDHPQVGFGPFLPFAQAKQLVTDSCVGLVSLTPDIFRVAYPSKFITYAGLGVPILALVEPESQLGQELETAQIGAVALAATAIAISEALCKLLDSPPSRDAVLAWYANTADQAYVLGKWQSMIEGLSSR